MSERPTDEADRPDASGRVDTDDDSGQSLPPRPDPVATPQDPPPGGPNAIRGVGGDGAYSTVSHDAPPQDNPATDEVPIEVTTGEDTDTEATKGNPDLAPTEESPA